MATTSPQRPPRKTPPRKKPVLVLGLGNDILSDDAVGLRVAREIRRRLSGSDGIEVQETSEMGLALLDYIAGFEDLVLVDAVQTGQSPPGFLHELDGSQLKVLPMVSPHFLGVGEMVALGRQLGLPVPRRIKIFAIEVQDPFTVSPRMTPALRRVLRPIALRVLAAARRLAGDRNGPRRD
ncbi:MAG: hydrogenase maturation protease [Verrucomicrobiota bacterium]|jgi:hydrogenase maturation protease